MGEEENIIDNVKELVDINFWLQDTIAEARKQLGLTWISRAVHYEQTGITNDNCYVAKVNSNYNKLYFSIYHFLSLFSKMLQLSLALFPCFIS